MKKGKIALGLLCLACIGYGSYYIYEQKMAEDSVPPVLSVEQDVITVGISATEEMLLEGVSAVDAVDGDVSNSILIEKIEKIEDTYNEFMISYAAFDNSSNYSEISRKLIYEDYVRPHFSLNTELRFLENKPVNLFEYITAEDCIDGEISAFVTISGLDDLMETPLKGIYSCTLEVTNSVGDTATLPLNVEIYQDSYDERIHRPTVYLTNYLVYLEEGDSFNPNNYLDHILDQNAYCRIDYGPMVPFVNRDGEEVMVTDQVAKGSSDNWVNISKIDVDSNVNTSVPGVYNVTYSYTSASKGYETSTNMIVVVE